MTARRFTLAAAALLLALVGLTPLLTLLARTLVVDGRFSLHAYEGLLSSSRQWVLLANSITVSSLTALATVLTGIPLGILFGRTDLPLRRTFAVLFTVPLLIPPYILAVSWVDLFSAFQTSTWAPGQAVGQMGYHALFGLPGCVLVLFSAFLPVMILLTMTFLNTVNPRQEEAARLMMRWPAVLKRVTLPLILPGASLAAMLVFLLTLGEFSVASFLRYPVFPVESFVEFSAFYDIEAAMASAIPLAILAVVILLAEWFFLRDRIHQVAPSSRRDGSSTIRLGRRRTPAFLAVILLFILLVVAPLAMLLVRAGSMATYLGALERGWDSLLRSLLYATMGASLLTVLGFFTGYLVHTQGLRAWRLVDSMTIFLFALPGTVIGIALVAALNRPLTNWLYGTFAVVVLGYLVKYTALTSRITASAFQQVPR